jgi:hypothetical protein
LRDEWFNQIPLLAFQYSVHPTTPGVVLDWQLLMEGVQKAASPPSVSININRKE